MSRVSLTIDGRRVTVPSGTVLLEAARRGGIAIPTMCHLKGHAPRAVCRICVVALKGMDRLVPACATLVQESMQVETNSETVVAARQTLMEFILAEHGECDDAACPVEKLAEQLGVLETRFPRPNIPIRADLSSDFIAIEADRCIHCDRCIQACGRDQQVLARMGRGATVAIAFDNDMSMQDSSCTGCGDCVAVCPAGGLRLRAA